MPLLLSSLCTVLAMVQEALPPFLRPHMETDHQDHSSERF